MEAKKKIEKARAGVILNDPFYGSLLLRLQAREDPTATTVWTDGKALGYNPDFVNELTLSDLKGALAHEASHIMLCHHTRRRGRDHGIWNKAGDFAINDILKSAGYTLPEGALYGMGTEKSADEIYSQLSQKPQDQGGNDQDPDPQARPDDAPDDDDQQQQAGAPGDGNDDQQQQADGDDAGGPAADPGQCGEVRDFPGDDGQAASEAEMREQEGQVKTAIAQAAQAARSAGRMPNGLDRIIQDILEPELDWTEILRRFVDETAKADYSWSKPNRRHIASGLYMPSLYSQELGNIVIAIDTSGSINHEMLAHFDAELSAALETYTMNGTVIYCDDEVQGTQEFTEDSLPLDLEPKGGGMTDFRPPFDFVEDHNLEPKALIYFTDLRCFDYPPDPPPYPVLWVQWGDAAMTTPPFGEVVKA